MSKKSKKYGGNVILTLDQIDGLDDEQRMQVLEFLAWSFWRVLRSSGHLDEHGKTYDPLIVDDVFGECRSYVFDVSGKGGRGHQCDGLLGIQSGLERAVVNILEMIEE